MAKDSLLLLLGNPFYGVYFSETDFSLQIESIHGLKHDYINILQDYLLQHTSPFSVKELRDIGLADIVGKIKILESNMFQNDEWAYLDDSATIDIADLQQRLLDFLFDSFVKRHPSK